MRPDDSVQDLPHPTGVDEYWAPHCDPSVLHAPGSCSHCDMYPAWQRYRVVAHIAFTGQPAGAGLVACPSEQRRPLASVHEWPGNKPSAYNADQVAPGE